MLDKLTFFIYNTCIEIIKKNGVFIMSKTRTIRWFIVASVMLLSIIVKAENTMLLDVTDASQLSTWRMDGSNKEYKAEITSDSVKINFGITRGRKWAAYKRSVKKMFTAESTFICLRLRSQQVVGKFTLMLFDSDRNVWTTTIKLAKGDWKDYKIALNSTAFKCKGKNSKDAVLKPKKIILVQLSVFNQPLVSFEIKEIFIIKPKTESQKGEEKEMKAW